MDLFLNGYIFTAILVLIISLYLAAFGFLIYKEAKHATNGLTALLWIIFSIAFPVLPFIYVAMYYLKPSKKQTV